MRWKSCSWSPDGTQIAFSSLRNGDLEIYVMDSDGTQPARLTFNTAYDGQVATRVSATVDARQANGPSVDPFISADDRYIVFESSANNLVPDDTNNRSDIFIRNQLTGQTGLLRLAEKMSIRNPHCRSTSLS